MESIGFMNIYKALRDNSIFEKKQGFERAKSQSIDQYFLNP